MCKTELLNDISCSHQKVVRCLFVLKAHFQDTGESSLKSLGKMMENEVVEFGGVEHPEIIFDQGFKALDIRVLAVHHGFVVFVRLPV